MYISPEFELIVGVQGKAPLPQDHKSLITSLKASLLKSAERRHLQRRRR